MMLATTQRSVGLVLFPLLALGLFTYLWINIRQSRREVGSEIEIAPNRKPYYADEEMEGLRLDRYLSMALGLLVVISLGLPLYWLAEPGRQSGAIAEYGRVFATRGKGLYDTNCASCHAAGAVGGVAPYILAEKDGSYSADVQWKAPALNNALLRFDRDEVRYVLDHGRAFSPMQPWSVVGGGAMNAQQIDNIIDYLQSVTISPEEARQQIADGLEAMQERYPDASEGELLFNLQAASGSYSCARCHTGGWSFDDPAKTGTGGFGPNLVGVDVKFRDDADFAKFLTEGCELGKIYGAVSPEGGQAQCKSGMMPGFGQTYTAEQIREVIEYVKTLDGTQQFDPDPES